MNTASLVSVLLTHIARSWWSSSSSTVDSTEIKLHLEKLASEILELKQLQRVVAAQSDLCELQLWWSTLCFRASVIIEVFLLVGILIWVSGRRAPVPKRRALSSPSFPEPRSTKDKLEDLATTTILDHIDVVRGPVTPASKRKSKGL